MLESRTSPQGASSTLRGHGANHGSTGQVPRLSSLEGRLSMNRGYPGQAGAPMGPGHSAAFLRPPFPCLHDEEPVTPTSR